jgi:hypothetical protein
VFPEPYELAVSQSLRIETWGARLPEKQVPFDSAEVRFAQDDRVGVDTSFQEHELSRSTSFQEAGPSTPLKYASLRMTELLSIRAFKKQVLRLR